MKKTTAGGYRAHELEFVIAKMSSPEPEGQDQPLGRKLYYVEGLPGLFRRYPIVRQEERKPNTVVAWCGKGLIMLRPEKMINDELGECGMEIEVNMPNHLIETDTTTLRLDRLSEAYDYFFRTADNDTVDDGSTDVPEDEEEKEPTAPPEESKAKPRPMGRAKKG